MKLSTHAILQLVQALNSFDGLEQTRPGEKLKEPYKIAPRARMTLAKNLIRLNEVTQAYHKTRDHAVFHYADGGNRITDPKKLMAFSLEEASIGAVMHEVSLEMIKEGDLNLEKNDIPLPALAAMGPIIIGMIEETAEVPATIVFPAWKLPEVAQKIDSSAKNGKAENAHMDT